MQVRENEDPRDALLTPEDRMKIMCDWVGVDTERRRSEFKGRVVWVADFELPDIGDSVIVWPGCCFGTVVDFSVKRWGETFERAVWVKLGNGEIIKMLGRECRMLTEEDKRMIENMNDTFRKRLIASGKKVERQRSERRARVVVGSHLLDRMLEMANGLTIEKKSGFHKITGSKKKLAVYVSLKGGRTDLNGFSVDHPACVALSEQEARERHLGRVRGQLDFGAGDEAVLEAYGMALDELR